MFAAVVLVNDRAVAGTNVVSIQGGRDIRASVKSDGSESGWIVTFNNCNAKSGG